MQWLSIIFQPLHILFFCISNKWIKKSIILGEIGEMESKKDLRIIKTEKAIRDAFFEIRKEVPLERVKVSEICKRALINPSTFYKHFSDVIELSDTIEDELVSKCLEEHEYKSCLFTDPLSYFMGFQKCISDNHELLYIVFKGRTATLMEKTEKIMRANYLSGEISDEEKIKVIFVMGGILHTLNVLHEEGNYDKEILPELLAELIKKL